jgi:hypothetical protein
MLFDPKRHEPLITTPWSEVAARAAIERIAAGVARDFTSAGLWPVHPLDNPDRGGADRTLYFGATGVMWGLEYLHREGAAGRPPDFADARGELLDANRRAIRRFTRQTGSLWMGDAGILLTEWQRARSDAVAAQLAEVVAANHENLTREFMWGAPGTMLAALTMHEWTGERAWSDLFRASATALWTSLEQDPRLDCAMWTQDLYGSQSRIVGAAHGFAGNALPLIRGRRLLSTDEWKGWQQCIANTIATIAVRQDGLANWTQSVGTPRPGRTDLLVQYCHGAPGVVICVAGLPDPVLDEILVEAGELIWRAGPVGKGAGLCHGTAGNGYAFLKLLDLTENELWLDRARAFAMHAIEQSERHRQRYGCYRHSLWTGDVGLAIYLWSCIRADSGVPTLDYF